MTVETIAELQAALEDLRQGLVAKGYPEASAHLDFHSNRESLLWLSTTDRITQGPRIFSGNSYRLLRAPTLTEVFERARRAVAEVEPEPTEAMRPWFEAAPAPSSAAAEIAP